MSASARELDGGGEPTKVRAALCLGTAALLPPLRQAPGCTLTHVGPAPVLQTDTSSSIATSEVGAMEGAMGGMRKLGLGMAEAFSRAAAAVTGGGSPGRVEGEPLGEGWDLHKYAQLQQRIAELQGLQVGRRGRCEHARRAAVSTPAALLWKGSSPVAEPPLAPAALAQIEAQEAHARRSEGSLQRRLAVVRQLQEDAQKALDKEQTQVPPPAVAAAAAARGGCRRCRCFAFIASSPICAKMCCAWSSGLRLPSRPRHLLRSCPSPACLPLPSLPRTAQYEKLGAGKWYPGKVLLQNQDKKLGEQESRIAGWWTRHPGCVPRLVGLAPRRPRPWNHPATALLSAAASHQALEQGLELVKQREAQVADLRTQLQRMQLRVEGWETKVRGPAGELQQS